MSNNIFYSTHITTRDINPFNTDKLYMYYTGNNSIVISIIVIENLTYQKVTFYNGVTYNSINSSRFMKYTGTLQAEKDDAYFIFETDEKSDFEKVLVQVKLPQKATNKYYGYIASDKSAEKCIILDMYIDNANKSLMFCNIVFSSYSFFNVPNLVMKYKFIIYI